MTEAAALAVSPAYALAHKVEWFANLVCDELNDAGVLLTDEQLAAVELMLARAQVLLTDADELLNLRGNLRR